VYKRKILFDKRGVENGLRTALKSKIRDIEDKMELFSILIAREHALAEVMSLKLKYRRLVLVDRFYLFQFF
jgi:thymidylate kinase